MKTLRVALAVASILLLGLGYAASQWAALSGTAPEYAKRVDQAPIRYLALFMLVAAVALALLKDKGEDQNS